MRKLVTVFVFMVVPALAAAQDWWPVGSLGTARAFHTATLLPDGKVLVAGGEAEGSRMFASAELFDPTTANWSGTGSMGIERTNFAAVLLPSGKVLVAGGRNWGIPLASAELYDPATGTWSDTGAMATARDESTLTLLPSGKVLVAGGDGNSMQSIYATAELYDPITGTWSPTGSLTDARYAHTATLLASGKVLVAGGNNSAGHLASAELYDSNTGTWSPTGSLGAARFVHAAALLPSGNVLVAGGFGNTGTLASAETYDPGTGSWSPTGALAEGRYWHTATLVSGKVLAVGGAASAEQYDPATGSWSPASTPSSSARVGHTATLFMNQRVLIAGGYVDGSAVASAEVYNGDLDRDGYAWYQDCNDSNPTIHPGALEVKHDGIDQDCNGYDLTIDIVQATYGTASGGTLTVRATSALGPNANLVLNGFGAMTWDPTLQRWTITVTHLRPNPGSVTVSGPEGSETAPVM